MSGPVDGCVVETAAAESEAMVIAMATAHGDGDGDGDGDGGGASKDDGSGDGDADGGGVGAGSGGIQWQASHPACPFHGLTSPAFGTVALARHMMLFWYLPGTQM